VLLHLVEEATFPARLGQAGPVTLHILQTEVAQMAGVSRETVSRLLTAWERDGVVTGGRVNITVNDAAGLRQYLENRTESPPRDPK
jgi:CRP-like cAMP-binding protein